jgi:predicted dehydrogenase
MGGDGGIMNFAIIGLGKIGIMHTAMVRNIPGANLAALIDREPKLGRHVQSMMSNPVPFFTSVEEAVQAIGLQGAFVCTPQFAHRPIAETCLELGLDVFVEKPLAHHLHDAQAMVEKLTNHPKAITAVGFMKAHEGKTREVGRLIKDGVLGPLDRFEASCFLSQVFSPKKGWIYQKSLSGGGMVINSTCHLLHTLHYWFGPPKSVTAKCQSIYSMEVEDEADIELEYASFLGKVVTSWSKPGYDLETSTVAIYGRNGNLHVDPEGFRLELKSPAGGLDAGIYHRSRWELERSAFNLSPGYGGEGYYCEDEDFIASCRHRHPAHVTWHDALLVQQVIEAIYSSHGQRIALPGVST